MAVDMAIDIAIEMAITWLGGFAWLVGLFVFLILAWFGLAWQDSGDGLDIY